MAVGGRPCKPPTLGAQRFPPPQFRNTPPHTALPIGPRPSPLTALVPLQGAHSLCPPVGCIRREGEGPQRRLDRRLEEVAEAVGGGYCRLQMPLRLALCVRGTVAGCWWGALEGGGGLPPSPSNASPPPPSSASPQVRNATRLSEARVIYASLQRSIALLYQVRTFLPPAMLDILHQDGDIVSEADEEGRQESHASIVSVEEEGPRPLRTPRTPGRERSASKRSEHSSV